MFQSHQGAHDYSIGFVELDEQGWLWSQPDSDRYRGSQLLEVQHRISDEAHLTADAPHSARGIILVTFVHGWKNNGRDVPQGSDENDVGKFREMLESLARQQNQLPADQQRKVVGVYVGWPGLSATIEPFKELSFYSRKNAGDRVGYYNGVTEVLCTLEKLHRTINESLAPGAPASCFVTVGHSFGAQVVYDSVSQILMQRLVEIGVGPKIKFEREDVPDGVTGAGHATRQVIPVKNTLQPFGDLVVLINPAFEAERYENLWRLSRQFTYPNGEQRPVFAIFSSEGDWATHIFFPLGRFTSTLFERYRDDSLHDEQKQANHHTIPWIDRYVTHYLKADGERAKEDWANATPPHEIASISKNGADTDSLDWLAYVTAHWNHDTRAGTLDLAHCTLIPKEAAPNLWTPFYVVRVSQTLVKDHSDIWRDGFREFLVKFIEAENPPFPKSMPQPAPTS